MPYNVRILLYAVLVGASVIALIFSFPSLTTPDVASISGGTKEELEAVFDQELSFCESQPDNINCQCFANISRVILSDNEPRVPGARYADKQDLARGQAADSC